MPTKKTTETANETALTTEQVQEVVKKKQSRPQRSENYKPHYQKGDMARMITNAMELSSMGEVDMYDPE